MVLRYRFVWELSTMTQGFGHNFIPLSILALRGTRSQTIFRNIPKGGPKTARTLFLGNHRLKELLKTWVIP